MEDGAVMHFKSLSLLLLPTLALAAPPTDAQLLETVQKRATTLEEVTTKPVLMLNYVALLCGMPTDDELAESTNNPHLEKYSRLYVNKVGRAAAEGRETTHPAGTVLLKEKLPAKVDAQNKAEPGTEPELFTGMVKREKGFNPDCGDWEFFTVTGDMQKIASRGKLANCIDCHRRYKDRDFTSRLLVPKREQEPAADGNITLHSKDAWVLGKNLRYEPQPHKNTLGFWTVKEDTAHWDFKLPAGRYEVEVLQGCGKGSGGAEVALQFHALGNIVVEHMTQKFTVEDTGHFQNFKPRVIGQIETKSAGEFRLKVVPQTKPGVAVMDLRQVVLRPVSAAKPEKP